MQNFEGTTKSIMVFLKKACVHCEVANHNPFPRFQELRGKLEHDQWRSYADVPFLYATKEIQSDPVNANTGGRESVLIMGVSVLVLSGLCYLSQKYKFYSKNTLKKLNEDISIVKLNISNLHKAVITWNKSTDTQNQLSIYYLFKTVLCILTRMMPE